MRSRAPNRIRVRVVWVRFIVSCMLRRSFRFNFRVMTRVRKTDVVGLEKTLGCSAKIHC